MQGSGTGFADAMLLLITGSEKRSGVFSRLFPHRHVALV